MGIDGDGKLEDVANINLHDDLSAPSTIKPVVCLMKLNSDVNLQKADVGSVLVWVKFHGVPMTTFNEDGLSNITTKLGRKTLRSLRMVLAVLDISEGHQAYKGLPVDYAPVFVFLSSYARAIIDLRANEELKDSSIVAMPKLVFGHVMNECSKKIVSDVVKNLNNSRQATICVLIGPKNSKSAGKGFLNVAHGSFSNTPIIDKIDKLERQILDGKLMFVNDDGNPLVPTDNVDSESEVDVVFDDTANLMASTSFKGGSDR
nr:hypothetical protein [Tanacetum cinerariifolium]